MQPKTNKPNPQANQPTKPTDETSVTDAKKNNTSTPEVEQQSKSGFYQDLNSVLLVTILSLLIYTIVGSGLAWVVSWGLAQANLYPWVFNQSPILLWAVFGLVSIIIIGAAMVQVETVVEERILPKLQKFSQPTLLLVNFLVLVGLILGMYWLVSNFINYLNVTFWLK
jgi:hypothetical protein